MSLIIFYEYFGNIQKYRHRGREQIYGYQGGKRWGERNWEWD